MSPQKHPDQKRLHLPATDATAREGIQAGRSTLTPTPTCGRPDRNRDRCPRSGSDICACQKAAAERKAGVQRTWPQTRSQSMRLSDRDAEGNLIEKGPRASEEVVGQRRAEYLMSLQEARGKGVDRIDWAYSRPQSQPPKPCGGSVKEKEKGGKEVKKRHWEGLWGDGEDLEGLTPVCSAVRTSAKDPEEPPHVCKKDRSARGLETKDSVRERCREGWEKVKRTLSRGKGGGK